MPTEKATFINFCDLCGWTTRGGGGGHPESAIHPTCNQVEATLLLHMWLREEFGCHHHGAINPLLHPGIIGTWKPNQSAAPSAGGWSRAKPLHVIGVRKN